MDAHRFAMDGTHTTTSSPASPRAPFRRVPATLAAVLAILAAAASPVRAAPSPAARWPVGGAALSTAMAMATEHWGMSPCGGQVALRWTGALAPGVNAQSSWANDIDPYMQPSRNSDCSIALSTRAEWDWPMLCTVVIHEVGHLTGHDHVDDEHDVMYYAYVEPAYECTTTAEPAGGPAPAAIAAPPKAAARARPAAGAKAKAPARPKPKAAAKGKGRAKGGKAAARGHR